MKLSLLLAILVLLAFTALVHGSNTAPGPKFKYQLSPNLPWQETEVDTWGEIITNYELSKNKNIVMNFTFIDQDLARELNEKKLDDVVASLFKGKEYIYSMMGVTDMKITSKKLTNLKLYQMLEIKSQYTIKDKTYFLIEKYHVLPKKILLSSLRYTSNDSADIALAQKDFNNVLVTIEQ